MVKLLTLREWSASVHAANRCSSDPTGVVDYILPYVLLPPRALCHTLDMGSIFHIALLNAEYMFHCMFL